jgi:16S rRNA (guanine966-N2)-methyltransferase
MSGQPPRPRRSRSSNPVDWGPAPTPPTARVSRAPGEVRIIGGTWRRSRLPVANWAGLRPTPDRVRETLFNWLGQDLSGWRCCDAFAGSGALGFEAASRGAASVWMVEREGHLVRQLTATRDRLGGQEIVSVRVGDGILALKSAPAASFDLVLLDPPFGSDLLPAALLASVRALTPQGRIYAESESALTDPPIGLRVVKHLKAGHVHAHLLTLAE